ncbi:MAG: hypothetical protein IJA52_02705 [Clostridia bacterium]|nr:hypothetical protein [Clostridia bacterium]
MPERKHDDELIKIKKRDIKEKPKKEKVKKEKIKKERPARVKSAPRARGVKLDFTEEAPEINRYWLAISKRYRAAKYISIVLLCTFLLSMMIFQRENITYANLVYLARDLDSDVEMNVGVYASIPYERSMSYAFEMFRGRVGVAGTQGFSLYSQSGSQELATKDLYASPRIEAGEKYALVWGAGERDYSVYTTIARVLTAESEFDIEDGCVSDSGSYALLTKSKESRFMINVYNESFKTVTTYYKDKLVMDIALDATGEHLAVASADVAGASVTGELMIGKVGSEERVSFDFDGMMPLAVEYTDDGSLVMLCDSGLVIFEGEKEKARVSFEGMTPGAFSIEGDIIAISFPTNATLSQNALKVFDTAGKAEYNIMINTKVTNVTTDGTAAVYAVGEGWATRLSLSDGKTLTGAVDTQVVGVLSPAGNLIVCTPDGTKTYFTDK